MKIKYLSSLLLLFIGLSTHMFAQTDSVIVVSETSERVMGTVDLSSLYTKIAYLNTNEILDVMPERKKATEAVEKLNESYKAELRGMQADYNKKYSDFISHQNSMADNIRLRRMQELYETEQHINDFLIVSQKDVEAKEKELLNPIRKQLKEIINQVGIEAGYVCIYDLANPTIAFVTPEATDITALVKTRLGIRK